MATRKLHKPPLYAGNCPIMRNALLRIFGTGGIKSAYPQGKHNPHDAMVRRYGELVDINEGYEKAIHICVPALRAKVLAAGQMPFLLR